MTDLEILLSILVLLLSLGFSWVWYNKILKHPIHMIFLEQQQLSQRRYNFVHDEIQQFLFECPNLYPCNPDATRLEKILSDSYSLENIS